MSLAKIFGIWFVLLGTIFSVVSLTLVFLKEENQVITIISSSSYLIGSLLMIFTIVREPYRKA